MKYLVCIGLVGWLVFMDFLNSALPLSIQPWNRRYAFRNACIANLKQIDGAKEQWALEHHAKPGTEIKWDDLVPAYLKTAPVCPYGGIYVLGRIDRPPFCTEPSHQLP